jgi:hypothetical protein
MSEEVMERLEDIVISILFVCAMCVAAYIIFGDL